MRTFPKLFVLFECLHAYGMVENKVDSDYLLRYNESCASLDQAEICENDCSKEYSTCITHCGTQDFGSSLICGGQRRH